MSLFPFVPICSHVCSHRNELNPLIITAVPIVPIDLARTHVGARTRAHAHTHLIDFNGNNRNNGNSIDSTGKKLFLSLFLSVPMFWIGPMSPDCPDCQHHVRTQEGPHAWNHACRLQQAVFPNAWECAFFQPPALAELPAPGMGYVWDNEFEGRP